MGDVVRLFGLACLVLSPFAFFQIITKAGHSGMVDIRPLHPVDRRIPWNRPYSEPSTPTRASGPFFDQLGFRLVLTVLSGIFVMVMFFIFAFSAWPSLQGGVRSRFDPGLLAGGVGPVPPFPVVTGAPTAPEESPAQPPGGDRTGTLGSGEQSYWDGATWTARRRWSRGAWVDVPLEPSAGTAGETGPSQDSSITHN